MTVRRVNETMRERVALPADDAEESGIPKTARIAIKL
jgi:hypothetical protein